MSGSLSLMGKVLRVAAVAACVAAGTLHPALAEPGPGCVSVAVREPVELPDGSVYPAGSLSLCIGPVSGVTTHQRVYVGGIPVGILLSHRADTLAPVTGEPSVQFRRVPSGRLQLAGYAWPSATGSRTYRLSDPGEHQRSPRFDVSITPAVAQRAVDVPAPPLLTAALN